MPETDFSCTDADHPYLNIVVNGTHVTASGQESGLSGFKIDHESKYGNEGVFVKWNWDGERLVVENDRYGLIPLFYHATGNELTLSTGIHNVLRHSGTRSLDYTALSVVLRLGHCIGNDTPFSDIKVLPPRTRLVWSPQKGTTLETQEHKTRAGGSAGLSFDDAVDLYVQLFDEAMGRRLPTNDAFTVPLSGGRDSRHILLSLFKHGYKPKFCPTLQYRPPSTGEDIRIAGLLCSELGIEHRCVARLSSWLDGVRKDVHLTNFCGGGHSWSLPLAAYLNGRVNTVYDGLAGSVLSGGFKQDTEKLRLFELGRFESLANSILSQSTKDGFNNRVLKKSFLKEASYELAVHRLSMELSEHSDSHNGLASFIFWNRTRRCVGLIPYGIMGNIPLVHTPYLGHQLFDFLFNVNPEFTLNNRLHDEAIKRGYPEYANIPFEDKALKAEMNSDAYSYFRRSAKEFARYVTNASTLQSSIIRPEYIIPRSIIELFRTRNALPWYLVSSVYVRELERAIDGV